jgi:hypothetical protein
LNRSRMGLLVFALLSSGCYRYAYHERSPVAGQSYTAIDEQKPLESVQFSYAWGLASEEPYSPEARECDGKGAGKVEVVTPWYGVPLALVTLGIVVPARVILYCNTNSAPGEGP